MTTLTINIPDAKATEIKRYLKAQGVTILVKAYEPNATTQKAIAEAHEGKTEKISDLRAFLKSI